MSEPLLIDEASARTSCGPRACVVGVVKAIELYAEGGFRCVATAGRRTADCISHHVHEAHDRRELVSAA
jgi:hypothetical protein